MKSIIKRPNGSKRVFRTYEAKSMTDQSFAKDCDVNHIVKLYTKTKDPSVFKRVQGVYADHSNIPDLHEAMNTVTQAQQTFNELPANIRERFGNSPVMMLNFLADPRNDEESVALGLKAKRASTPSSNPNPPTPKKAPKAEPPSNEKSE